MKGEPGNIPSPLTTLIGRDAERRTVAGLVDANRLVTLTGAGGCGKTRLAGAVAADVADAHPDGAWWVDLARLSDPELVASAVAGSIGTKEIAGQPLIETLVNSLRDRQILIVLDNCEHLVGACAELADHLLTRCAGLRLLATSREPLGVEGEVTWRVPSLGVPEDPQETFESIAASHAIQLFADRAQRVRPHFELTAENAAAVAEICRRLDGIPLAIELAAARARMMTPQQLVAALEDRFHLLTGSARTALPRHRALRASVDWSYALLTDEERTVLRRLSVFAGGFSLEAAEDVCSGDGIAREGVLDILSRLVDRSLVQVADDATVARYRLLETIREYSSDQLSWSGEQDRVRTRHLRFFVALAERAAPEMLASGLLEWLAALDAEHDNIRAAFEWSAKVNADDEAVRIAGSLWLFWAMRAHLAEGRSRFDRALRATDVDPVTRATALIGAGQLETYHGDLPAALAFSGEALGIARDVGDERLEGRALDTLAFATAFVDPPAAPELFRESTERSRQTGDGWFLADALNGWGLSAFMRGDLAAAGDVLEESVACSRSIENPNTLAVGLGVLGYVRALQGRLEHAESYLTECLVVAARLEDRVFTAEALFGRGFVEAQRGRYEEAAALLEESVELAAGSSPLMLVFALTTQSWVAAIRGDVKAAAMSAREGLSLGEEMGFPWPVAVCRAVLADAALAMDDPDAAREHIAAALDVSKAAGMRIDVVLAADARLARRVDDRERAESLHHEALKADLEAASVLLVPAQLEALAGLAGLGENYQEAARLFGAGHAARDALGLARFAADEEGYRADLDAVRSALGEQGFEDAWSEGSAMSLEEAIAYSSRGRGERKRPSSGWAGLTPTETEVVRLVAEGLTNPQIADRLFVSRSTVKAHLNHIFTKLGVATRAELAAAATRREL